MGLNIKNEEVHALVRELADLTGNSQTGAIADAVRHRIAAVRADAAPDDRIGQVLSAIRTDMTTADRKALVHSLIGSQDRS